MPAQGQHTACGQQHVLQTGRDERMTAALGRPALFSKCCFSVVTVSFKIGRLKNWGGEAVATC